MRAWLALIRKEAQAIALPSALGRIRPASIWAASGQFVRTKSTMERRVASGTSAREA